MALIIEGGLNLPMPKMVPIRQKFSAVEVKNIPDEIKTLFQREEKLKKIKKGSRIAVAVGSRGIHAIDKVVSVLIHELKQLGTQPFIVPAMGSHGGATAEGQRKVLAGYGVTEETMGVPVRSSMEVEEIGKLENGTSVYLDKEALSSDGIVVVNRVKPHTAFKAEYESGLIKMLAIGLGKHKGATAFHSCGMDMFGELLPQLGKVVLAKAPVLFGLAIIENAYDHAARFEIVWNEDIVQREKALLAEAKSLMPRIIPEPLDLLIVHELGKEISGSGMDPNITGRSSSPFFRKPDALRVQRIVVLNLTAATKGNATGLGMADITTKKVVDNIDMDYTYINAITSGVLAAARIPLNVPTDLEAIQLGLKTSFRVNHPESRIVWIKNTLALEKIFASETLLPEIRKNSRLEVLGDPKPMHFDEKGNLLLEDKI
jgi:Lactate racemase N-terminal domain